MFVLLILLFANSVVLADYVNGYDYTPPNTQVTISNNNQLPLMGVNRYFQPLVNSPLLTYGAPIYLDPMLMAFFGTAFSAYLANHQKMERQLEDQSPINPYLELLLSQYGRYLPNTASRSRGLYYYTAANNFHNNKPFGAYKIHENT